VGYGLFIAVFLLVAGPLTATYAVRDLGVPDADLFSAATSPASGSCSASLP
jgi:hypothetical protein